MNNKIKVESTWPQQPWRGKRVQVTVSAFEHSIFINIYPQRADEDNGRIYDFKVNWSALGTVPAEDALIYGQALKVAARTANALTTKYRGRKC